MKSSKSFQEYMDIVDSIEFSELIVDLKNVLRAKVNYIDINKLLLISAYRFNDALEDNFFKQEDISYVKEILEKLLKNLPQTNFEINCKLEEKSKEGLNGECLEKQVKYSINDLKRCISKFVGDTYLTEDNIKQYKEKINSGEIKLQQLSEKYADIIFSEAELENLSGKAEENLIYVYKKNNWTIRKILDKIRDKSIIGEELLKALIEDEKIDSNQIIELYNIGVIPLDNIEKIKNNINLMQDVNFEQLNIYYKELKNNLEDETIKNKYRRYLELFKEVCINEKSQEEIEENSDNIFENIAMQNSEGQEYYDLIKEYYKNGIITFNTLKQWITEPMATELFKENLLSTKELKDFKLSNEYYISLVNDVDMEYNTKLDLMKQGVIPQEEILSLFLNNKLFEKDLLELIDLGLVNATKAQILISKRTLQELEEASSIKLNVSENLTKKSNDKIYYDNENSDTYIPKPKNNLIIDPNKREQLIKELGFYLAKTNLSYDSPFYNYQFYIRPDKNGEIGPNSLVIAERYYENKVTESEFCVNNATYFFKYKDLMVLGSLKKSEMTKERENIVFTSNHVLAKNGRKGSWAASVLQNIVKTAFSSDLKEYTVKQQTMINREKLLELLTMDNGEKEIAISKFVDILYLCNEIDNGEHNGEIHIKAKLLKTKNNTAGKGDR